MVRRQTPDRLHGVLASRLIKAPLLHGRRLLETTRTVGKLLLEIRHAKECPRRRDEERFGLEYDLDVYNIVAVSDFNMGGAWDGQP